jgi:Transposase DDE domain group 1
MYQSTCPDAPIVYRLDPDPTAEGEPLGSSAHGGLPSFLAFVDQLDVWRSLKECLRLPVQERRTGFTQLQKSQVLVAALAAGCRRSRDNDFTLTPDPLAAAALGLPRWPHSSQLTRHLRAFRSQHVGALRRAVTAITAQHSTVRRRLRRGERVVIDIDQTAISANGRTYQRTARGHLKHKGDRGYQATAAFAGDTSGGEDEVLALFLDPGNTHASHRFVDVLAALEDLLGPLAHLPGLVLRFDAQYATATDLALLLRRGIRFVGRNYASTSATTWARELGADAAWHELNLVKWVCDLGVGPVSAARPDVVCRRLLVRATGARQRAGYTAIVTNLPADDLPAWALEPFYEARQTIEGWLSEATDALQLKGLWSRAFPGLEAFLLYAALTSNRLNWWERRALLPETGLPHRGLRQLIGRVMTLPARVLRHGARGLVVLVSAAHPYARRLVPACRAWQLPLPLTHPALILCDAHF